MSDGQNVENEKFEHVLERLKEKYLDLLIEIPLSYQSHEMVAIRNQIKELRLLIAEREIPPVAQPV